MGFNLKSLELPTEQVVFNGCLGTDIDGFPHPLDHGRPVQVIEEGAHSDKPNCPEQLLVVQGSVRFAKLGMALRWSFPECVVKRHANVLYRLR